jgi:hypothetical protein
MSAPTLISTHSIEARSITINVIQGQFVMAVAMVQTVSGSVTISDTNSRINWASLQSGTFVHNGNTADASVWYGVAQSSGSTSVQISNSGSSFDLVVNVYSSALIDVVSAFTTGSTLGIQSAIHQHELC